MKISFTSARKRSKDNFFWHSSVSARYTVALRPRWGRPFPNLNTGRCRMSLVLKVFDNGDHTALVWRPSDEKPIPACRGFAIQRTKNGVTDFLLNPTGFDPASSTPLPSNKSPYQRFMWWDYDVKPDDAVQYRVIPCTGPKGAALDESLASDLTP